MTIEEIEKLVIKWGEDRDLYPGSTIPHQFQKLIEELTELVAAYWMNCDHDFTDAIGDMMVVLTHIAKMYNLDLLQCYEQAYNEIKDRKGKIVNGIFVKEG